MRLRQSMLILRGVGVPRESGGPTSAQRTADAKSKTRWFLGVFPVADPQTGRLSPGATGGFCPLRSENFRTGPSGSTPTERENLHGLVLVPCVERRYAPGAQLTRGVVISSDRKLPWNISNRCRSMGHRTV